MKSTKRIWRVLLPLSGILFIVSVVAALGFFPWGTKNQPPTGSIPSSPCPDPTPPTPGPKPPKECGWHDYRLPNWVHPEEYRLDIDVDLKPPFPVSGRVEIDLTVTSKTQCVLIHAQNMDVVSAVILESGEEGN